MFVVPSERAYLYRFPNKEFYEIDREYYTSLAIRFKPNTVETHAFNTDEYFLVDKNTSCIYMSRLTDENGSKYYLYNIPPDEILEPARPRIVLEDRKVIQDVLDYVAKMNLEQEGENTDG